MKKPKISLVVAMVLCIIGIILSVINLIINIRNDTTVLALQCFALIMILAANVIIYIVKIKK